MLSHRWQTPRTRQYLKPCRSKENLPDIYSSPSLSLVLVSQNVDKWQRTVELSFRKHQSVNQYSLDHRLMKKTDEGRIWMTNNDLELDWLHTPNQKRTKEDHLKPLPWLVHNEYVFFVVIFRSFPILFLSFFIVNVFLLQWIFKSIFHVYWSLPLSSFNQLIK